MERLPEVSVIIPCYNHEGYIRECLLSVLRQSYPKVQVIVIDDGSTDHSPELIRELQQDYTFIFERQENHGISATLNKGIQQYASGKYIAIVASDDYWVEDKLARQVAFMEENPQAAMVYGNAFLVNEHSENIGSFDEKRLAKPCTFRALILDKVGIPALTVMVKREVFQKLGHFDVQLAMEDWDMWLRIADQFPIAYLPGEVAYYRFHPTNISAKKELMMKNRFLIMEKWKEKKPALYQEAISYWRLQAFRAFSKEDKSLAKKYLRPTFANLFKLKYYVYLLRYIFTNPGS